MRRFLIAFLAAPTLPALVAAGRAHLNGSEHALAIFFGVCGAFYVLQLVVGVVGNATIGRARNHRLWAYALIGFCVTALPMLAGRLYRCLANACALGDALPDVGYVGALSAATAAIYWLIARPDRVGAPPTARSS